MKLIKIESPDVAEFHLTLTLLRQETPAALAQRLAKIIHSLDATIVRQIAFGPVAACQPMLGALRQALDAADVPLTWVEGLPCDSAALAGIQIQAIGKANVQALSLGENASARIWRDATATHCVFSNLGAGFGDLSRPNQTQETFVVLQGALARLA
jgi:hypothetical protein